MRASSEKTEMIDRFHLFAELRLSCSYLWSHLFSNIMRPLFTESTQSPPKPTQIAVNGFSFTQKFPDSIRENYVRTKGSAGIKEKRIPSLASPYEVPKWAALTKYIRQQRQKVYLQGTCRM